MRRIRAAATLVALVALTQTAGAQTKRFNWDTIGAEFCRRALAGDVAGLRPLFTPSLAQAIDAAVARSPAPVSPTYLLQTYANSAPQCAARTRNVALVEIEWSGVGGVAPKWTEYLVIVPLADGTSRIDDMLFATRRSDTLRARLTRLAAGG